ncbi:c6 finger domain protein [Diplodia corticola]|uniref:C6 finger domain protein n=1 Tax=Diplodia corticola TaxID=236234 RepID=A0A1J9R8W8_9PEZI|nr:c6 finger domain protein [Diplodia corticola]OJD38006.1 c6 finger domain protein [Diplodia corticola]
MVYCGPPSRGCETCRKRKIRCDQLPLPDGCSQCSKAKRQCPGYRDLQQVLFRNESAKVERRVQRSSQPKKKQSTAPPVRHPSANSSSSSFSFAHTYPQALASSEDAPVQEKTDSSTLVIRRPGWAGNPGPARLTNTRDVFDHGTATGLYALVPSMDDRAAGFFFSNFCNYVVFSAAGDAGPGPVAQPGMRADLWQTSIDPHLFTSMKAVGLYGLYRHSRNPEFEKLAWRRYLDAIRVTNEALRNPAVATKDSSLLAVIILGLFESISGRTRQSLEAWENHVNGAAALVSMRGRRQLESAVGRRMLMQITSSLLISCLQRDVPFPEPIKELMLDATTDGLVDPANPLYRLREIMVAVADFRSAWRQGAVWDYRAVVVRSQELDGEMAALVSSLPPSWHYRVVHTTDDPEIVVNGHYHVYSNYWQAQVWNSIRTCRLLVLNMMRQALLAGFARTPPVFDQPHDMQAFAECTNTLYQLQAEVQASVPQHIGYLSAVRQRERYAKYSSKASSPTTSNTSSSPPSSSSPSPASSTSSPPTQPSDAPYTRKTLITRLGLLSFPWSDFAPETTTSSSHLSPPSPSPNNSTPSDSDAPPFYDDPCSDDWQLASTHLPVVRSYGSALLLWTLFLVGNQDVTTRATQAWAAATCAHIGEAMGLRQANVLADILKERIEREAREGVVRGEG